MQACSAPPSPDSANPSHLARKTVAERVCAVVVTDRNNLNNWANRNFTSSLSPKDADGGSAAPISADGYFLTADHVLSQAAGRNVFIICGQGGPLLPTKARVVWRSKSSDLALLHIARKTPYFYQWTPPQLWQPIGNKVIHGGLSTGLKSISGKLATAIPPEGILTGPRLFKIDIPLQPGDSGGPIVNSYGQLVGINSAVEFLIPMETAFFIESEGRRPNTRSIDSLIRADRARLRL